MTYKIAIFEDGYSNKVVLVHTAGMAKARTAGRRECDAYHKCVHTIDTITPWRLLHED